MSWKFDDKHAATIHDGQGHEWRLQIQPDSFTTFIWLAKPLQHGSSVTMYSGSVVWGDRDEAKAGAEATLSELGFAQSQESTE